MLRPRRALTPEEIDQRAREAEVAPAGIAARISKLVIGRKAGEGRSTARASRSVAEPVEPEPGPPDDQLSDAEVARLELQYRSLPKPRPPRTFDPGAAREASADELRAATRIAPVASPREARQAARVARSEQAAAAAKAVDSGKAAAEKAAATRARRAAERAAIRAEEQAAATALAEARRAAALKAAATRARNAAAAKAAEAAAARALPEGSGATAARRIPTRVIHTPQKVRDRYHLPPAPNAEPHHD